MSSQVRLIAASAGGHDVLETTGAGEASDRFVIEVTGGASRITVVETDA